MFKEIHSKVEYENYDVVTGIPSNCGEGEEFVITVCLSKQGYSLVYEKTANFICNELGIKPQPKSDTDKYCSIGYCERNNSWYGWAFRANSERITYCAFTIGSKVEFGDVAYVPTNMDEALLKAVDFWSDEYRLNTTATLSKDEEGKACIDVKWTYSDDPELIPNENIRGIVGEFRTYPPEEFGRGEWTARTLDDAKQMAIDFAIGAN